MSPAVQTSDEGLRTKDFGRRTTKDKGTTKNEGQRTKD